MSRQKRLWIVLLLNLLLVASLVIVGLRAHSLGVVAAGADYLADAAAIGVSLFAIWLAHRPRSSRRPEGYPHATTIAVPALVNAGWLLVLSALVIVSGIQRLVSGAPSVHGVPVLIVSSIAAAVMCVSALILDGDLDDEEGASDGDDLNMSAILLDTMADAAAAAGVAISGRCHPGNRETVLARSRRSPDHRGRHRVPRAQPGPDSHRRTALIRSGDLDGKPRRAITVRHVALTAGARSARPMIELSPYISRAVVTRIRNLTVVQGAGFAVGAEGFPIAGAKGAPPQPPRRSGWAPRRRSLWGCPPGSGAT